MESREFALKPRRELAALRDWLVGGSPALSGSAGLQHLPDRGWLFWTVLESRPAKPDDSLRPAGTRYLASTGSLPG